MRTTSARAGSFIVRDVKRDVSAASARADSSTRSVLSLSVEEHKRLVLMSESIRNLLEILELRKAVQLDRTEAVGRVASALVTGTFEP